LHSIVGHSGALSGLVTSGQPKPLKVVSGELEKRNSKAIISLIGMDKEKRALVEQAARYRNAAEDIDCHPEAVKRLRKMAREFESRAAGLEEARFKAELPRRIRRGPKSNQEKAALTRSKA
jgi:hypothetical protein